MILADTSVWISHLRSGVPTLAELLEAGVVLTHPMVIGELAMGSLSARDDVLGLMSSLPATTVANHDEVLSFINARGLHGRGLGWVDTHLLASTLLTPEARLWTEDRRLAMAAHEVAVAWSPA